MTPKYIMIDFIDYKHIIEDLLHNGFLHSTDLIELMDQMLEKICIKPFDVNNLSVWLSDVRERYNYPYPVSGRSAVGDFVFEKLTTLAIQLTYELTRLGLTSSEATVCYKVEQILNRRYLVLSERSEYGRRRYT